MKERGLNLKSNFHYLHNYNKMSINKKKILLVEDDPNFGSILKEYLKINGKWLSNKNFIVFHRLAIGKEFLNKGLAKKMVNFIEEFAISNQIFSIKADTNHDNIPMLKLFKSLGYTFCGIVHFRDSPRKAFEKLLNN